MTERPRSPQSVPERTRGLRALPDIVWSPLATGFLMVVPGVIGVATGYPLLFPSLGPTAFLQATTPQLPSARPYNVVVGHAMGIVAGYTSVFLLGVSGDPSVFAAHSLTPGRVWASVLAVMLTKVLQLLSKSIHAPAAATTLLIALGGFRPMWNDFAALSFGILITAVLGEIVRQMRLAQPGQR